MRPDFHESEAAQIAQDLYGFVGKASKLASYSDQNFKISCANGQTFVLKIANSDEQELEIDFQIATLKHIRSIDPDLVIPRVIPTLAGCSQTPVISPRTQTRHEAWMVSFLPGQFVASFDTHPPGLLQSLGAFLARLDKSLISFSHPAMHRTLQWDLKQAAKLIDYEQYIKSEEQKKWVRYGIDRFNKHVVPHFPSLTASVIHNDANDYNVLSNGQAVTGIIDFGDMVHTYTACELAIGITYMILEKNNPLEIAGEMLQGYHRVFPLKPQDIHVLFDLVYIRLCTSVCMSSLKYSLEPDNEYLAISQAPAWTMLKKLYRVDPDDAYAYLQRTINI